MFAALLGSIVILLLALPASAEVIDKVPAGMDLWAPSLAWVLICLIAGRIQPGMGLVFLAFSFTSPSWGLLTEILSSTVGPAIRRETGTAFIAQAVVASTIAPAAWTVGAGIWRRKRACHAQVGGSKGVD